MAIVSDVEIRLRADIARLQQDMTGARRSVDTAMSGITAAVQRAALGLGGIAGTLGLSEIIKTADQYVKFTAQLRIATDSTREYGQAVADVRRIANSAQADLAATGTLYARIASGTKDLGLSQQKVADIVEATNLSLKVSGATSEESASAILQLSQAFGSGALRGEEFNAVNEAAPRLLRAVADGLGVPVGALKEMASQGKLTAELLADVLPKALGKLRGEAAEVQTISGAFTVLKNNVMEFIGTSSQSSGAVSVLTKGIGLLANNLGVVAGAVTTLMAARLISWLEASASGALSTVAANRAMAASTLTSAEATATATAQASLLANARLAEVRAATLASAGETQLALTTNALIPAQARAAAAAEAHALAMSQLAIAQRAAAIGTTALSSVIAALGGPIGAVITVLGLAATAWSVYQSRQEEANRKASENTEASTIEIIGSLEKQNAKLRERIALSKQAGMADIAKSGGPGAERLASVLKQINDLKAKGNALTAVDQVELITLEGIYADLNKSVKAVSGSQAELDATGKAATDLVAVRERLTGVNKQYLDDLQKLQTAREKGAIKDAEYVVLVSKLATETWKSSDAGKAAEKQSKASAAAVKSEAEAYSDLLDKIYGRADGQEPDFQKNIALLYKGYQAGKQSLQEYVATVEDYIKQQKSSVLAEKARLKALEQIADFEKAYSKGLEVTSDIYEKRIEDAQKEADANEELARTFGMTKAAIEQVELARLKDQLAQRASLGLTVDEIAYLEKVIALKERSAKALASTEELKRVQDFWTGVEKTAHDTFVSIADGGKDTWQRLKDTAKNTFFEWLYQQTLKKWIINIQANGSGIVDAVSGLFGGGGSTGSNGAGGASSLLGQIGSIFGKSGGKSVGGSATSFMGGAGSYAGWIAAGMAVANKLFDSGYKSTGTINKKDYVHPMVAESLLYNKVFQTLGLSDKTANLLSGASIATALFGRKAPEITAQGVQGTISSTGFTGKAFADILEKGGLFRSDKKRTATADLASEQQKAFDATIKGMVESVKGFSGVLGGQTDAINGYSKEIKITLGKDEEENQKLIAEAFGGVGDDLARLVLPSIAQFQAEGETASATLQRLTMDFQAVDAVLTALGVDSQTAFRAVGVASLEARERLVALAGGLDALAQQSQFFIDNFLTDAERVALVQKEIAPQLAALGFASITTADQFKTAVQGLLDSGALATEEGAKQYAGLLALAPKFKTVADYLKGVGDAAAQTAKDLADAQAAMVASNREMLSDLASDAMAAVGRSVDAEKTRIEAAFKNTMDTLDAGISRVNDTIARTGDLSRALKGAITAQPGGDSAARSQVARAEITAALAIAKASGVLPTPESIADALATVTQDNSDNFSTLVDYQRAVARTNAELESLGGLTDGQLDTAQRQLQVLEAQKTEAQAAHDAEIERLDAALAKAQEQIDAVNGVNTSVLKLSDAVAALATILGALKSAPTSTGGDNPLTVDALYRQVLNRAPDAEGYAFWKKAYGDTVDQAEYLDFMKAAMPELQGLVQAPPTVADTSSATMSGSSAMSVEQQRINERMEASMSRTATAVEQLAQQFNNVSGGGNTLLVEPA